MINQVLDGLFSRIVCWKNSKSIRGEGKIVAGRHDKLFISKSSKLTVKGRLTFSANSYHGNGRNSVIRMDNGSHMQCEGKFTFMYGADIILFEGAELSLGDNSFINSDCKIRCHERISIGKDCAISHDFTVMDSDAHELNGVRDKLPVSIGDHVWIGTRVTILKGVQVGDGAVIAAGSLVISDVPPRSLVGGVPAKVIKKEVEWGI